MATIQQRHLDRLPVRFKVSPQLVNGHTVNARSALISYNTPVGLLHVGTFHDKLH